MKSQLWVEKYIQCGLVNNVFVLGIAVQVIRDMRD